MAAKTQAQLLDYIAENYPDVYGLLSIDAGVKAVLLRAAEKQYTPAKLRSELAQTTWWKKTAAPAREWDAAYAQDRATGNALLEQTRRDIKAQAARMGVTLPRASLDSLALSVRRLGWTGQMVQESLAARFRAGSSKPGTGTAAVDAINALAGDYGVTMSDGEKEQWARRLLAGQADEAGVRSMLVKRAKGLYGTIADEISEGTTVRDYFDPYVQRAAQMLGLNPAEVDFTDSKWQRAIANVDPATGKRVPMAFDAWERELRKNPIYGYDQTARGQAEAGSFADAFARAVGYR